MAKNPNRGTTTKGKSDKRKQSVYFPQETLEFLQLHADRIGMPLSWIIQQAVNLPETRERIAKMKAVTI